MTDQHDYNRGVIEEFRANAGVVSGQFAGAALLLLTTTGAKSGQQRTAPMMYLPDGDRMVVFASQLGAPSHPGWYHNLVTHPAVTVEAGSERFAATAVAATGEERQRLWAAAAALYPFLTDHQAKTTRQIPVVVLTRRAA